jgi:hypothetical protein
MIAKGAPDGIHSFLVERILASHAANAISAKEFAHKAVVST